MKERGVKRFFNFLATKVSKRCFENCKTVTGSENLLGGRLVSMEGTTVCK